MVTTSASLPELTPEQGKAANQRYIDEYAAAWAAASPAERELATLEMKNRLSAGELARLHELNRTTGSPA